MLQGSLLTILIGMVFVCLLAMLFFWRQSGWFIQWLKGSIGFSLLLSAIVLAFSAADLWGYHAASVGKTIANVSIYQLGDQSYDVTITDGDGQEFRSMVRGDQWQLDVRLIRWYGPGAKEGAQVLYRLDRLAGRYLQLEQERNQERSAFTIQQSRWVDVWQVLSRHTSWLKAEQGQAQFMPLVNGAMFAIHADIEGVVARPMNDVAQYAMQRGW